MEPITISPSLVAASKLRHTPMSPPALDPPGADPESVPLNPDTANPSVPPFDGVEQGEAKPAPRSLYRRVAEQLPTSARARELVSTTRRHLPTLSQVGKVSLVTILLIGAQWKIAASVADGRIARFALRRSGPQELPSTDRAMRCVEITANDRSQAVALRNMQRVFAVKLGSCTAEGAAAAKKGAALIQQNLVEDGEAFNLNCTRAALGNTFMRQYRFKQLEAFLKGRLPKDNPTLALKQEEEIHKNVGTMARGSLGPQIEWFEAMQKQAPAQSESGRFLILELTEMLSDLHHFQGEKPPVNCIARQKQEEQSFIDDPTREHYGPRTFTEESYSGNSD